MAVKNYDPKKCILIVGGVQMSGFVDGTFIGVERTVDTFSMRTGADGEVTRTRSNDKSGTLTLTLLSTSGSNDVLSAFHLTDELTGNGIVPILITDLLGTTKIFASQGWVRKYANFEASNETSDREWMIDLAEVDMFVGGAN